MVVKPTQDEIGNEYSMAAVFSQLINSTHAASVIHCYLLSLDLQWHAGAMQYLFVNLPTVHIQGYWLQPQCCMYITPFL